MPEPKDPKDISRTELDDGYSATVYTWGVKPGKSKLHHQIGVKLFGGNVGHASIGLRFPADKRGDELIQKYCDSKDGLEIPYNKVIKKGHIPYYEVYFSVWRAPSSNQIMLRTLYYDSIDERSGINYDYKKRTSTDYDASQIENRKKKGWLGLSLIQLPPYFYISYTEARNSLSKFTINRIKECEKNCLKIKEKNDEIYKLKVEIKALRSKNPIDHNKLQQLLEQISKIEDEVNFAKYEISNLIEQYDLHKYVKPGKASDGVVHFPIIDNDENLEHYDKTGLSLENMLKAMRSIADDKEQFNLCKKNCSSTTLTILNAGIREIDRKWLAKRVPKVKKYLEKGAWFFKMLTPQSVYNAAVSMDKRFMRNAGIVEPIKGLVKPGPIKQFLECLKSLSKMFVDKNKQGKRVVDHTSQDVDLSTKKVDGLSDNLPLLTFSQSSHSSKQSIAKQEADRVTKEVEAIIQEVKEVSKECIKNIKSASNDDEVSKAMQPFVNVYQKYVFADKKELIKRHLSPTITELGAKTQERAVRQLLINVEKIQTKIDKVLKEKYQQLNPAKVKKSGRAS